MEHIYLLLPTDEIWFAERDWNCIGVETSREDNECHWHCLFSSDVMIATQVHFREWSFLQELVGFPTLKSDIIIIVETCSAISSAGLLYNFRTASILYVSN